MVIDAGDDHAVIWTEPDDWQVEPVLNLEVVFTGHGRNNASFLFADGAVHMLSELTNPATFKAMLTRAGTEVIDADDLK
jgi:hypothetical protein